jgi:heme/copper-type cytochrome/quinol oxidase subunit 2
MRSVADEIADWSKDREQAWRAEEAADWVRQAAAHVEDDAARRLAYEATRRVRRPTWTTALVVVSVVVTIGGVVVWSVRRQRRAAEPEQPEPSVES